MKLLFQDKKKVVVEVLSKDIEAKGFDEVWDEIRKNYDAKDYGIQKTEKMAGGQIIKITLTKSEAPEE